MIFDGLKDYVSFLESVGDLQHVEPFADPVLEIAEIADRMVKSGGKALLFENTGTDFPLLINAFASDSRMKAALHRPSLEDAGEEVLSLFNSFGTGHGFKDRILSLPGLIKLSGILPRRCKGKGTCQEVVMTEPDLGKLPVLKCWPHDGGRFVTLPLVHTYSPCSLKTNLGMYRMQVMGPNRTGMHWHRHKTGARHFREWSEAGERMPVTVTLGGDPVYTYAATAPMPENIDEYILAGFLRHKSVRLVKCLTNDIWIPSDSDFVIEGYVDPSEEPAWEGPFGDHTGFYSLPDWYPVFHVTCITHRRDAVYPATIVGVPPMEDAWIGKATGKIFLAPVKMTICPEIEDINLPVEGVSHNLVIVRIKKEFPGQGLKVLNALFGAGQMMFSKYFIVVSGDTPVNDYDAIASEIFRNCDLKNDILKLKGPLDILDHSSDTYSFGGKMGIDATEKFAEEKSNSSEAVEFDLNEMTRQLNEMKYDFHTFSKSGFIVAIISVDKATGQFNAGEFISKLPEVCSGEKMITVLLDKGVDTTDKSLMLWVTLGNTDPLRDFYTLKNGIVIDATSKVNSVPVFARSWPNVVCSDEKTIETVDARWGKYGLGDFILSPSLKLKGMEMEGDAKVFQKK